MKADKVGLSQTKYTRFANVILESGVTLDVTVAYETYGILNSQRSNAVLVCHALSGDAHAAGVNAAGKTGWWDNAIGPGKAFDIDKYFVICSNVLGGCQGTTGPSSISPAGRPFGLDFPSITIGDMVTVQRQLIDHLNIDRLLSVAGGSMGGMQALKWATLFPERLKSVIAIATTTRHSPRQIAFNEVGRAAIMSDPFWNGGNYYGGKAPERGLAMARMVGHITYMSETSMEEKFGRRFREGRAAPNFGADFEVSNYLHYKGDDFIKRFDPNSYLYITKALDLFDLAEGGNLAAVLKRAAQVPFLVLSFKSDWLYPAHQSRELVRGCKLAGIDVSYCEINSTYGHDAFLLEVEEEGHLVRHFLKKVANGITSQAVSHAG